MKTLITTLLLASIALGAVAQTQTPAKGLAVGDKAVAFSLKNIDGKTVSLADYNSAKGVILTFTCNHCPYSKAYESRIVALDKQYKPLGYPVVAINPNDPTLEPEDSFDEMKKRAKDKGFTFPYLVDATQDITKAYGATRTPHMFVLQREGDAFFVRYIGAIDDNHSEPEKVTKRYLGEAVDALLAGKPVPNSFTKAIGCGIKWRKV